MWVETTVFARFRRVRGSRVTREEGDYEVLGEGRSGVSDTGAEVQRKFDFGVVSFLDSHRFHPECRLGPLPAPSNPLEYPTSTLNVLNRTTVLVGPDDPGRSYTRPSPVLPCQDFRRK